MKNKQPFPSIGSKNNYLYQYTDCFKIVLYALRILKNNSSQKGMEVCNYFLLNFVVWKWYFK
jgi:hypothetical protein